MGTSFVSKFSQRLLVVTLLALTTSIQAINDSAWVAQNYTKLEQMVPMRDGVKLFTAIYAPRDQSKKHPILMVRTPYSCAPYGADKISPRLWKSYWIRYLQAGYILVIQDVRGRYMSEGVFEDVRPFNADKKNKQDIDEASDTYDLIEWLLKNIKGHNGNVGAFGISYPGFYATMAALSFHPALKAVSPQAPVTDWFMGDDFHHNGAFALCDGFSFYSSFGRPRPVPTTSSAPGFTYPEKDLYSFHLKMGVLRNYIPFMQDVKFWKDVYAHPDYDAWWKSRDARQGCSKIKAAILVTGGTFDAEDCYGAWNLYKAIESKNPNIQNNLVMGPWFHGGWSRGEGTCLGAVRFGSKTSLFYQDLEYNFFQSHLNGEVKKNLPEATVFFSGENQWRQFDSWPSKQVQNTPLYFGPNQSLTFVAPNSEKSSTKYISDPLKPVPFQDGIITERTREYMSDDQRFASKRTDVLVFQTDFLSENLTLGGEVEAELMVQLSSTDADFIVKIIDVFPDNFEYDTTCCACVKKEPVMGGYQMLVRGEIMRGRYRKGFDQPTAFVPGAVEKVRFKLPDVAHTFQKGHRLMIQIQSSWFPLFDRNPQKFVNIYTCAPEDFVPCEINVLHQRNAASCIYLPLLK